MNAPPAYRPFDNSAQPARRAQAAAQPVYRPFERPTQQAAALRPAPPPVYRPFDKSVQPAPTARSAAPAAYRPFGRSAQPASQVQPAPPPIYRPVSRSISGPPRQAPPVYGPFVLPASSGPLTVQKKSTSLAPAPYRLAVGKANPPVRYVPGSTDSRVTPGGAIQRYQVVPSAKIYLNPPDRPWFGYPYAIVGHAVFDAQVIDPHVGGNDEFLTAQGGNVAKVEDAPAHLSLRVSDDNEMAIEDSDLRTRQPKAFYATAAVVAAANQRLTAVGSKVKLVAGAGSITIWTGWSSQKVLNIVTPQHNNATADTLPQNCNAVGAKVIGAGAQDTANLGTDLPLEVAARLAPKARVIYQQEVAAFTEAFARNEQPAEVNDAAHLNDIAKEFVQSGTDKQIKALGANRYAMPDVGEAFVIGTVGAQNPQTGTVRDYKSGQDRPLGWSFHFGGVVARSGKDRITLENYARGDSRGDVRADPRWYFQMYGQTEGQSFHEFHAGRAEYANPVTVKIDKTARALRQDQW